MVNRGNEKKIEGNKDSPYYGMPNLPERHSRADWDTKPN